MFDSSAKSEYQEDESQQGIIHDKKAGYQIGPILEVIFLLSNSARRFNFM